MDLDEGIAEVAQFDADGAVGGGHAFFFATESSAFDLFETKTKGGGFTKYKRGKVFRIFGKGEDGEEISGASLFHEEWRGGGVEGALGHQTVDGVG